MTSNYKTNNVYIPSGQLLALHLWTLPNPRGWVLIIHGMAEHGGRYHAIAEKLNTGGWNVCAPDLRGHGITSRNNGKRGFFANKDGWQKCVSDMESVVQELNLEVQVIPVVILGHSMGAQIAYQMITRRIVTIDGAILSALAPHPGPILKLGIGIAWLEGLLFGKTTRSHLLNAMTFGRFNAKIKGPRTKFDWLSRDQKEVDKYIEDPDCGEVFRNRFFFDLYSMVDDLEKNEANHVFDKNLRLLLLAGSDDPVVIDEQKFIQLAQKIANKVENADIYVEPGGRHELLNDICRNEIEDRIVLWLDENFKRDDFAYIYDPA
ncbi:MAG: alpha/beta fold hydrolase [Cryomorphaceae bacterium]|nr:alpha/beta fold hydrolase [Cryomorphaceae bacterium]